MLMIPQVSFNCPQPRITRKRISGRNCLERVGGWGAARGNGIKKQRQVNYKQDVSQRDYGYEVRFENGLDMKGPPKVLVPSWWCSLVVNGL